MCTDEEREFCDHVCLLVPGILANAFFNAGESPFGCDVEDGRACSRYVRERPIDDVVDCFEPIKGNKAEIAMKEAGVKINNVFYQHKGSREKTLEGLKIIHAIQEEAIQIVHEYEKEDATRKIAEYIR